MPEWEAELNGAGFWAVSAGAFFAVFLAISKALSAFAPQQRAEVLLAIFIAIFLRSIFQSAKDRRKAHAYSSIWQLIVGTIYDVTGVTQIGRGYFSTDPATGRRVIESAQKRGADKLGGPVQLLLSLLGLRATRGLMAEARTPKDIRAFEGYSSKLAPPKPEDFGGPTAGGAAESAGATPKPTETPGTGGAPERLATRNTVKGTIGEQNGYAEALGRDEIGIQAPGKTNAPGPDYITMRFNPDGTASIKMYDAKFANGPKSLSEAKIASWMKETRAAVDAMRPGPLKDAALQALKTGRVEGEIYIYNK